MISSAFCRTVSAIVAVTERSSCDKTPDVTLSEVIASTGSPGFSETAETVCSDDFALELTADFVAEAAEAVLAADDGALELAAPELPDKEDPLPEDAGLLEASAVFAVTKTFWLPQFESASKTATTA